MSKITIGSNALRYRSLYSLLLKGHLVSWVLFCVACGIASYFGYETVRINGEYVTGLYGLFGGIVAGPFFAFIFGSLNWLFVSFGLWIYTLFKPIIIK